MLVEFASLTLIIDHYSSNAAYYQEQLRPAVAYMSFLQILGAGSATFRPPWKKGTMWKRWSMIMDTGNIRMAQCSLPMPVSAVCPFDINCRWTFLANTLRRVTTIVFILYSMRFSCLDSLSPTVFASSWKSTLNL